MIKSDYSNEIKIINQSNRAEIDKFIKDQWFGVEMAVRGKLFDLTKMPGFAYYEDKKILGLITYEIDNNECEIMSLDSLKEKQGIGTALVKKVEEEALKNNCTKLKLVTTNDNLNAMKFYQKRGFEMSFIYTNAVDAARKLKPSIPETGDFGIPIKHEIEFIKKLRVF